MRKFLPLTVVNFLLWAHSAFSQTVIHLDNTNLVFYTGGSNNIGWNEVKTGGAFDGVDMAISGTISGSQATWIQTTVVGPGTLSFWWSVSSEPNEDFLQFYIDGNLMNEISGDTQIASEWQYGLYNIDSGTHILMWQYAKSPMVNQGQDQGYLDQVIYTTNPPIPLQQALNTCGVDWYTGGNTNPTYWAGETNVTHDGVAAAQSGALYAITGGPQESWLMTPVNGATNVSFWWKVSCNSNQDWLEFYIDNNQKARITGEVNWTSNNFAIPSGATNLEWFYFKSNSMAVGSDRGWLDQVVIKPRQKAFAYSLAPTPGMISNQFQLSVAGEAGCTCRVDFSTNLATTNWTALTNFVTTGTTNVVIDYDATEPQRFYRAVSP